MLTCREVSRPVAADELEAAGSWSRVGVRFHLLMCRHCRRYSKQLGAIGRTARKLFQEPPEDRAVVDRLREAVFRTREPDSDD